MDNSRSQIHYPDKAIRLVFIPLFTILGYYLTYNIIDIDLVLVLQFTSDLIKAFVTWEIMRRSIMWLDIRYPWTRSVGGRILRQLPLSIFSALLVFIIMVELEYAFIRPQENMHFYSFDIFIVSIFLLCGNILYTALYFYSGFQQLNGKSSEPTVDALPQRFLVRVGNKELNIPLETILGFYSEDKQSYIITEGQRKLPIDLSLNKIEETIPPAFFRVNRQYILTRQVITDFSTDANGKVYVRLLPDLKLIEPVVVSREKASGFKKWMRHAH